MTEPTILYRCRVCWQAVTPSPLCPQHTDELGEPKYPSQADLEYSRWLCERVWNGR